MIGYLIIIGTGVISILMVGILVYMLDRGAYLARKKNGIDWTPPKFLNFSD